MSPRADAISTLDSWRPADPAQEALRHAFLGFLAAREDSCERECAAAHITASAVVFDHTGEHVLLTLHPRVGRWIQLGGHCERGDVTLAGAALRESREESGMDGLLVEPDPLHVDVHPITCSLGVPTRHFDVRFLIHAPSGARPVRSEESTDLRWWPVTQLPSDVDTVPELVRLGIDRAHRGQAAPSERPTFARDRR